VAERKRRPLECIEKYAATKLKLSTEPFTRVVLCQRRRWRQSVWH